MTDPLTDTPAFAVTWLYVPASRPDRIPKALGSSADVVIVDLEDAVAAGMKEDARHNLELLETAGSRRREVRINAKGTPWFDEDLVAIERLPRNVGVRIPKAEDPEIIRDISERLPGRALTLLIESAIGVENAFHLASCSPSVTSLGLGEADLKSELGVYDEAGLGWIRSRVVVAARAAGLRPPAMSAFTNIADREGLIRSCSIGKSLGMVGRSAIHPKQLDVIRASFRPSPEEIEKAQQVIGSMKSASEAGEGTVVLEDGTFLDKAMIDAAQRTLDLAR